MGTSENKTKATWVIHLFSTCPLCGEDVDLLDDYPDFWDGRCLEIGEHDSKQSRDVEVVCPECGGEFLVDLEY